MSNRLIAQAMDIAGLSKATSETIILLLSVLSFMVGIIRRFWNLYDIFKINLDIRLCN
jgi:hypothetical protein